MAIPVAERSMDRVFGHLLAGIVGLNPAGSWICVSCDCCILSGRDLCYGLIAYPEESY